MADEKEQARAAIGAEKVKIRQAWRSDPTDLYALGVAARVLVDDADLSARAGYPSVERMLSSQLPELQADQLLCAALLARLVDEGGYARPPPGSDPQIELPGSGDDPATLRAFSQCTRAQLQQALDYASSHGGFRPPPKTEPPKTEPPTKTEPPPPARIPRLGILALVALGLALLWHYRPKADPTPPLVAVPMPTVAPAIATAPPDAGPRLQVHAPAPRPTLVQPAHLESPTHKKQDWGPDLTQEQLDKRLRKQEQKRPKDWEE